MISIDIVIINIYKIIVIKEDDMINANFMKNYFKNDNDNFITDLVKIYFQQGNLLCTNCKNVYALPSDYNEEILSALAFIKIKDLQILYREKDTKKELNQKFLDFFFDNNDKEVKKELKDKLPKESTIKNLIEQQEKPLRLGQLFYIQIYFSDQFIYYDQKNNRLTLSKQRKTAFKVIEQISKNKGNNYRNYNQNDYIGNIVPNELKYLISLADQALFMKFTDQNIYMGTYDEKCLVSFSNSFFKSDKVIKNNPLLNYPCRLYSVEEEKYLCFDISKKQIMLKKQQICLQGMCVFEKKNMKLIEELQSPLSPSRKKNTNKEIKQQQQTDKYLIHILQNSSRYYMVHKSNSDKVLLNNINSMISPFSNALSFSKTLYPKYEPTFTLQNAELTFNQPNLSQIHKNVSYQNKLNQQQQEEKELIIQQLTFQQIQKEYLQGFADHKRRQNLLFVIELYPNNKENVYEIFIYNRMNSKIYKDYRTENKQISLYLDYKEVTPQKSKYVLKEYQSQNPNAQNTKFKNILRVQFITKNMIKPYIYYQAIVLSFNIYDVYNKKYGSKISKLNTHQIQQIMLDFKHHIQQEEQNNKIELIKTLNEILDLKFIDVLQDMIEIIVMKFQIEQKQENLENNHELTKTVRIIMYFLLSILKLLPDRLIEAVFATRNKILFVRMCEMKQIRNQLIQIKYFVFKNPNDIIIQFQIIIKYLLQNKIKSPCLNICVLLGCKLIKIHNISSRMIEELSEYLMRDEQQQIQKQIIRIQLIKLKKAKFFYSQIIKCLQLKKINDEQFIFEDRQKYLQKIYYYYKNKIQLPFDLLQNKDFQQFIIKLTRDNKMTIINLLEDTLVKNTKFQMFQNKMLSFQILQLYLQLGQGIKQAVIVEQQSKLQYIPHILAVLQENLVSFAYQTQSLSVFSLQILKCISLLLKKYIHGLLNKQLQIGEFDQKIIIPLICEQFQQLIMKKNDHQQTRKSIVQLGARKYSKLSKLSKKTQIKSIFNKIMRKDKQTRSAIINNQSRTFKKRQFLKYKQQSFLKKQSWKRLFNNSQNKEQLISIIDKQVFWTIINKQYTNKIQKQQKLTFFQKILQTTNILISPISQISKQLSQSIYHKQFTPYFIQILIQFINKTYKYNFTRFIQILTLKQKLSQYQWQILIIIIDKNKILKYFFIQSNQNLLKQIYNFLKQLYLNYLYIIKNKIQLKQFKSKGIDDQHIQLNLIYYNFQNQLNPFNIIELISKNKITYIKEEIIFHYQIIKSLGLISQPTHYKYYQQYLLRYQCQNYKVQFLKLCQIFFYSLTQPLKQRFSNNFQYSLFKQAKQIKKLLHKITQISNTQEKQINQKRQNFKFLNQLDQLQSEKDLRQTQDKQLLQQLFKLLIQIQKRSKNQKIIVNFIGFSLLVSICMKYHSDLTLKMHVIKYICVSVDKQINYQSSKYSKNDNKQQKQLEQLNQQVQQYKDMVSFIKNSNYFLRKQFQNFKNYKTYELNRRKMLNYIQILITIVMIRRRISKHYNLQTNEKFQRQDSLIKSQSSQSQYNRQNSMKQYKTSQMILQRFKQKQQELRDANINHQTYFYQNTQGLQQNEIQSIQGINRLLCLQILQNLQIIITTESISSTFKQKLIWLQNQYHITIQNNQFNIRYQAIKIIYRLQIREKNKSQVDDTYAINHDYQASRTFNKMNIQNSQSLPSMMSKQRKVIQKTTLKPQKQLQNQNIYIKLNNFLSTKIQNYLVLLIQLLKRSILIQQQNYNLFQKGLIQFIQNKITDSYIIYLMNLIIVYLDDEIELYQKQDEKVFNENYEQLPQQYYKRQRIRKLDKITSKYIQKCCRIQRQYLQILLQLLLISFKINKHQYIYYFHLILDKFTYYNISNQIAMQDIIIKNFNEYSLIIYYIGQQFKTISPIAKDEYYLYYNILNESSINEFDEHRYQIYINSKLGIKNYHIITLNFISMMRMIISTCKHLNFQFKELFAKQTINKQSIISQLISILELCLDNMKVPIQEKYQVIRILIKIINSLIRGPVQANIEITINLSYDKILRKIFKQSAYKQEDLLSQQRNILTNDNQLIKSIIGIKKLIAETLFMMIPYLQLQKEDINFYEAELTDSYSRSKRLYKKHYSNIIVDYTDKTSKYDAALLYFDLALNFFYCLTQVYNKKGINTIVKIRQNHVNAKQTKKSYAINLKIFYQIYTLFKNIFRPIYNKIQVQYQNSEYQKSYQKRLQYSILFFSKNVSIIDVKIGNKIKQISFLLLKQAKCVNESIKNECYRLIGRQDRRMRLTKFMSISKYLIIRLQVVKKMAKIIQNFKPLDIIVNNRQLWKNLCYFNGLLLNILFIFKLSFTNFNNVATLSAYVITAVTYLYLVFIYIVYFMQNVPLKVKLYKFMTKNQFSIKRIIIFFNDKTLWFALFYTIVLSLSIHDLVYITLLFFDYFFRFKFSNSIMIILFRSSLKIFYILLMVFQILYVFSLIQLNVSDSSKNCSSPIGCTQQNFYILMDLRSDLNLLYTPPNLLQIFMFIPTFVLVLFNVSLIIGIIFIQKRNFDQQKQLNNSAISNSCFICGGQRNDIQRAKKSNKSFFYHVQIEHNIWNYVFYLIFLKNKERKYLNSIQSMIIQEWKDNKINWLPDNIIN